MARGGARKGAGRPKGRCSDKTAARLEAIAASGITPLDYLLNLMRDEKRDLPIRLDAAKSAAPYVHPKLANIEHSRIPDIADLSQFTAEELAAALAETTADIERAREAISSEREPGELH